MAFARRKKIIVGQLKIIPHTKTSYVFKELVEKVATMKEEFKAQIKEVTEVMIRQHKKVK